MTLRQPEGIWSWDDETEACVTRVFSRHDLLSIQKRLYPSQRQMSQKPTDIIAWCMDEAVKELGEKANINMIAAAVADHLRHRR